MVQSRDDLPLWFSLEPSAKVASFKIVAQGSTPGLQTVPRSEMAALVWASRWGLQLPDAEVTVYTDAQCTFEAAQKLKSGQRLLGSGPASDLEDLLPQEHLSRLHVVKVKAHTEQAWTGHFSAEQQWFCLGNEAADLAAKQARRSELPAVLQYSDNIAEHVKFQETHMLAFARYLVLLNVADARLRETCNLPEGPAEGVDQIRELVQATWQEWTDWDPQPFWTPDIVPEHVDLAAAEGPLREFEVA